MFIEKLSKDELFSVMARLCDEEFVEHDYKSMKIRKLTDITTKENYVEIDVSYIKNAITFYDNKFETQFQTFEDIDKSQEIYQNLLTEHFGKKYANYIRNIIKDENNLEL